MREADQYVTPEARYAEQVDESSGVRHQVQGAPPYPLYGLNDDALQPLHPMPIWHRPWFCYTAGAVGGIGLTYAVWRWVFPILGIKLRKNPRKKSAKKLKKKNDDE